MRTMTLLGRGALAGMVVLAGEAIYASWRPLPSFEGLDPSGTFGRPWLPPLRMTVLGDSTITGPGLERPEDTFVAQIALKLSDRHRVELRSLARGGARSADVLRDQVPRAIEWDSELTVVSVGGNDVLHGTPVWAFERNLDAIVAAMSAVSGAVVLMGVGDIGTVPRFPVPLDRLATLTGRIADRVHGRVAARHGVQKADHWGWSASAFKDPSVFAADRFHPNAIGHQIWAAAVLPAVEHALGATAGPLH